MIRWKAVFNVSTNRPSSNSDVCGKNKIMYIKKDLKKINYTIIILSIFSLFTFSHSSFSYQEILKDANIALGVDYPYPIIDYTASRKKALDAFKKISN